MVSRTLDAAQFKLFRNELQSIIDPELDSLRFYTLGNKPQHKVEHIGAKPTYSADDLLML